MRSALPAPRTPLSPHTSPPTSRNPSYNDPALLGVKLAPPITSTRLLHIQVDPGPTRSHRFHIHVTPAPAPPLPFSLNQTTHSQRSSDDTTASSLDQESAFQAALNRQSVLNCAVLPLAANRAPYIVRRTFSDLFDFDTALRKLLHRHAPHFLSPVAELAGRDLPIDPNSPAYRARDREVRAYLDGLGYMPEWVLEHELFRAFFGVWPLDMIENTELKKAEKRAARAHPAPSPHAPIMPHVMSTQRHLSHGVIEEEDEDNPDDCVLDRDVQSAGHNPDAHLSVSSPSMSLEPNKSRSLMEDDDFESRTMARMRNTLTKSTLIHAWDAQIPQDVQRRLTGDKSGSGDSTAASSTRSLGGTTPQDPPPLVKLTPPTKSSKRLLRPVTYNPDRRRISLDQYSTSSNRRESGVSFDMPPSRAASHEFTPSMNASKLVTEDDVTSVMYLAQELAPVNTMKTLSPEYYHSITEGYEWSVVESDRGPSGLPMTTSTMDGSNADIHDRKMEENGDNKGRRKPGFGPLRVRSMLQVFSFGGPSLSSKSSRLFRRNTVRAPIGASNSTGSLALGRIRTGDSLSSSSSSSSVTSLSSPQSKSRHSSANLPAILDVQTPAHAQHMTQKIRKVRSSTVNSGASGAGLWSGATPSPYSFPSAIAGQSPSIGSECASERSILSTPLPMVDGTSIRSENSSTSTNHVDEHGSSNTGFRPQTAPVSNEISSSILHFRIIIDRGEHYTLRLPKSQLNIASLKDATVRKWTMIRGRAPQNMGVELQPVNANAAIEAAARTFIVKSNDGMVSRIRTDEELHRIVREEEAKKKGRLPRGAVITVTLYWV